MFWWHPVHLSWNQAIYISGQNFQYSPSWSSSWYHQDKRLRNVKGSTIGNTEYLLQNTRNHTSLLNSSEENEGSKNEL